MILLIPVVLFVAVLVIGAGVLEVIHGPEKLVDPWPADGSWKGRPMCACGAWLSVCPNRGRHPYATWTKRSDGR